MPEVQQADRSRRWWWRPESVLVLGDSHAHVFRNWRFRARLPRCRFRLVIVGGATASGLENPKSTTQARPRYERALRETPATRIVTLLGEVDAGFVIWYRANKYGQSVAAMLELAVENYAVLLRECTSRAPTTVVSAPIPTITDGQQWGEVADARREITATLAERTGLTRELNARLAERAACLGCGFVDLDEASLGPDGTVAARLRNPNPLDHHFKASAYAAMLAPRLAAEFAQATAGCSAASPAAEPRPQTLSPS